VMNLVNCQRTGVVYFNALSKHVSDRTENGYKDPSKEIYFYGEDIITATYAVQSLENIEVSQFKLSHIRILYIQIF
jgi:hypothetical protein